jgi:hypothetical protein
LSRSAEWDPALVTDDFERPEDAELEDGRDGSRSIADR